MTKKEEEQSFRVTDKRSFTEDGQPAAPDADDKADSTPTTEPPSTSEPSTAGKEAPPRPPIDFPSYVLSYYTQGLVLLGEVPNPYTNKKEEDVDAARHTVDILSMLKEKTKGNLSQEEQQLLDSVLYELRMKFMAKTDRIKL